MLHLLSVVVPYVWWHPASYICYATFALTSPDFGISLYIPLPRLVTFFSLFGYNGSEEFWSFFYSASSKWKGRLGGDVCGGVFLGALFLGWRRWIFRHNLLGDGVRDEWRASWWSEVAALCWKGGRYREFQVILGWYHCNPLALTRSLSLEKR
jgi:hypothetical protein